MSRRLSSRTFALACTVLVSSITSGLAPLAQQRIRITGAERPGRVNRHITLLPNGWRIAPSGRHHQVGDLPLSMVLSPDGRFVIVSNNGWSKPSLTIYDVRRDVIAEERSIDHAWLGLAWHPDHQRLYVSGAKHNSVTEMKWANARLQVTRHLVLGPPQREPRFNELENAGFVGGIAVTPTGDRLFAVQLYALSLSAVDLADGTVVKRVQLPAEPYTCVVSPNGRSVFVSMWGGARVLAFDAATLEPRGDYAVGEHPNAMAFSKDGRRLFVACANTNRVWVLDLAAKTASEQISISLYPHAPAGSTPNGVAVSPDGNTLLVANADNNTVAVVDVATPGASEVEGFIPVGWYPTAVAYDPSGQRMFVLNGKGLTSAPNPRGPQPDRSGPRAQYTGSMFEGALSVLDVPDRATLKAMTRLVYELTPYTDAKRLAPGLNAGPSPIPRKVGQASPIKHVFYVIRENRTYDQVLGDLDRGNGDPSLTLFGEDITPNAHALAREFPLFDNFYVDAEVSYDGHAFSTGAYATDVVEKIWPTQYGGRGGLYLSEGGWQQRTAYGNFSAPPDGYIWDFATRAGLSVRSYGEFARWPDKNAPVTASVPGLEGRVHPSYPPFDLDIPDQQRADIWLEEFREFERNGQLPRLSIIRLGGDHTVGTRPGAPSPRAMIADNDLALGRIVEVISSSRYWNSSAIFVLEDDAQNGPDHVDAHRSVAFAISPYSRRRIVDSTLYTTSGMLRTMELILGLPPMSQYDAAATPMYAAFQTTPDLTPFLHRPARVPLDEVNDWNAPGAQASLEMNLDEVDLAPEFALNEILWKAMRGKEAVMPPPVRAAFVRHIDAEDDER